MVGAIHSCYETIPQADSPYSISPRRESIRSLIVDVFNVREGISIGPEYTVPRTVLSFLHIVASRSLNLYMYVRTLC